MKLACLRAAAAFALAMCGEANALPFSATFSATTDDASGHSFDVDFSLSPNEHVTLNAGAGQSTGSDKTADLRGTLLNAGASFHGDRGGVSLDYDRFDDSSNYHSAILGARAWISAGDFEFALLARQRDMGVDLTLELALRTVRREVDFAAAGVGAQVTWTGDKYSAYAMALKYDYDDDFDNFIALINSPQLAQRPIIEGLVGSFITQARGAIDRQAGAGVERAFGRHSLALDVASVHDAMLDSSSVSAALTWRFTQSAHVDWSVSGGMVDSDAYGQIGFLGMALGLTH
jgi:hypothetical protein